MPRPVVPGQPLHLIQRGNNRAECFVDDEDRTYYLRTLREASRRMRCAIHAYVLMTNHVHLLLTPEDEAGPARMMQGIGRRYVRYFNERHDRTGTLWEGRFRSTLIDSDERLCKNAWHVAAERSTCTPPQQRVQQPRPELG